MADEFPSTIPDGLPDIGSTGQQNQPDPVALAIAQVPAAVDQSARQTRDNLIQGYQVLYNAAWRGGMNGLTPKQFFKALGAKAAAFLIRGSALRKFVNEQYPEMNLPGLPPNYDVTVNADGTASVAEKE